MRAEVQAGARIMGFGHRVYRVRDPRADVLGAAAVALGARGGDGALIADARTVEAATLRVLRELQAGSGGSTPTSSSTPRCSCTASACRSSCSRRPSPWRAPAAGRRTCSSRWRRTGSSARRRATSAAATGGGRARRSWLRGVAARASVPVGARRQRAPERAALAPPPCGRRRARRPALQPRVDDVRDTAARLALVEPGDLVGGGQRVEIARRGGRVVHPFAQRGPPLIRSMASRSCSYS